MSVVRVYSGPYLRGPGAEGDPWDPTSSNYDPLAVPPSIPSAAAPPYVFPTPAPAPSSEVVQTAFGTEEYPTIQPGAQPGSGGSYPTVPNPSVNPPGTVSVPGAQSLIAAATNAAINFVPKPSPTVAVPLSTSSIGLLLSGTTFGLPTWMVLGGGLLFVVAIVGGSGRRRR